MSRLAGRKVVFVLPWAALGGAERSALALARHLREEEGAEVEVVALTAEPGRGREMAAALGIPWLACPVLWTGSRTDKAAELARLIAFLRRRRPHALMPYCSLANVLCGLIWPWTGARTCLWHQRDVSPFRRLGLAWQRRAVRLTPLFAAVSRAAADHLVQTLGAPQKRVSVIRSRTELAPAQADRAAWRRRLGVGEEALLACMPAHLHVHKDHAILLRAWRRVVDRLGAEGRSAVLLLAGRPAGTEDALKALAYDLELGRSVRFLGEVEDVAGLLAACDVGVLSSRREGLSQAVLECMATGLPVAGTDIPGIREAVGEEGLPFLAAPGDDEGLAQALLRLAEDEALRRTLGERNKERVRAEFNPERALAQHAELLAQALAISPSQAGTTWKP
jgi:glycosyltransferase involved in cell wall biosynthesis